MMTVQLPLVTPDFALRDTIIVLVGVVVGGIDRLWTATLGGFTIGFVSGLINGAAADRQDRLPALGRVRARDPRPAAAAGGALRLGQPGGASNAYEALARRARRAGRAVGCSSIAVGLVSTTASPANQVYFLNALVSVAIVVSIYVFVGNSGVLSFGQISFVAVGAFAAGVMTVPLESKKGVLTTLFPLLRDHTIGNVPSLLLAAALGGRLRVSRRAAADAALRASRPGSPPSPCSRSRTTCCASGRRSAPARRRSRSCPSRPGRCRRRSARSS